MEAWFLISYVVWAIVVAIIASARGRRGFTWFLISILISPLVGMVLVLALGRPGPNYMTHRRCPDCKELVLIGATKCKHCGTVFTSRPATTSS